MAEIIKTDQAIQHEETHKPRNPMVFISHDTRDAEIAEAFSKLLGSVSAGVLKSFRSSDRKGNQGIEYGIEWYPEIMKKLETASDVVCLLTPNSTNRPWILYEAGVAKGKLETPVYGVALGIPLTSASTGPFAQFQNCDDAEDSLTSLVIQLVSRIPNAEPDRDVVKMQVQSFKTRANEVLISTEESTELVSKDNENSGAIAKMFEEIKIMYQDLPSRMERRFNPDRMSLIRRRRQSLHPRFLEEIVEFGGNDRGDPIALLVFLSQFKDDFPWLYELGAEAYRKIKVKDSEASDDLKRLMRMIEMALHHPMFRELGYFSKQTHGDVEESLMFLRHYMERWMFQS